MNVYGGNGGNGGPGGPENDDFDDLIRDPEYDFEDADPGGGFGWEDPSEAYRRYSARARGTAGFGPAAGGDRSAAEALARVIELIGGLATEALPIETRRQLERTLRDLLVVLRDTIDRLIDRLDEHDLDSDVEIEEIRID